MPIAKGHGRARGSKVIADDVVPSSEVRGDLLDNEIQFDVSPKPDPAGEARNILVAMPPAKRAEVALESSKTEKQLRELVSKSSGILSVVDGNGRDEAHRAGMTLKNARVHITNTGKAAREDAQAFAAAVIAEEKRLIAITKAEEERVLALRDTYDEKVKREKEEAERLARERAAAIRAAIDSVASLPGKLAGATSAQLADELQKLAAMKPTAEGFDGMLAEMLLTIETVGSALHALLEGARKREEVERQRIIEQEAERARLAAQAEENARIAAELEFQRQEMLALARAHAQEIERVRLDMERERAELEALREAMKPKPAPIPEPEPARIVIDDSPDPSGAAYVVIPTSGEPQFDWNTPAEQLEAMAITPPAAEPEPIAPVETMIDQISMSMAIGVFFDAVRDLRHHRTADDVRQHLEVVLNDVQGEISQGSRVYK